MAFIDPILPSSSTRKRPAGACDTHNHVFGRENRFPLAHVPDYPMPLATLESYLKMLDLTGLDRGVLVQPTQQDTQMAIMLDALHRAGGRLRGVAAATLDVSDAELETMKQAGITGLRFVEAPMPNGGLRPGAVDFSQIAALSSRLHALDWSIHVWAKLPLLIANLDKLLAPQRPLVIEHMGMLDPVDGLENPDFQTLLSLLREGRIWVKLSVCRCSTQAPHYSDLQVYTEALIKANPDQVLWGSDWPFIRMQDKEPDVTHLLDVLLDWINDAEIEQKVLAGNPAKLFGFDK